MGIGTECGFKTEYLLHIGGRGVTFQKCTLHIGGRGVTFQKCTLHIGGRGVTFQKCTLLSLVHRPSPSFLSLAVWLSGRGLGGWKAEQGAGSEATHFFYVIRLQHIQFHVTP